MYDVILSGDVDLDGYSDIVLPASTRSDDARHTIYFLFLHLWISFALCTLALSLVRVCCYWLLGNATPTAMDRRSHWNLNGFP